MADAKGANWMIWDSQGFGDIQPIAATRPKMAFIAVTDRCNSRCRHCPHYHSTFGTDMSEAVMRKAIDALAEGLELIAPQGLGEPLMAKPFYMLL
jgi:molybdenum cofactor biosynthesis enzyme MoaA